jgi:hypothetical protein
MKIVSVLFIVLFFPASSLQAQRIAIEVQAGHFIPSLSGLKGDIPNCAFNITNSNFPDVSIEYTKPSGLLFSATVGYQRDWLGFSEIARVNTYGGPLLFAKTYTSFPFILSSGYACDIGESHFRFNSRAGIGFGMVHSNDVTSDYSFDGIVTVYDEQGQNHMDSQHVKSTVTDGSVKKILPQARISVALEYQVKKFFARVFVEGRSWLGGFGEVEYHSENSSAYYQYSQVTDGHFSLRTGYLGAGIGIGWSFRS